ncbi:MAG: phytoene desaturase family protein [Gemmatimonadales bacterium]
MQRRTADGLADMSRSSAVVVGAGPNGLAAGIALTRAGSEVTILEAANAPGGGARTAELTLPGFHHDVCSAIHPMAVASPFFRTLPLASFGLEWIQPEAALAHPFADGSAVLLRRSVDETARDLGEDAAAYRHVFGSLAERCDALLDVLLAPALPPRRPLTLARFGLDALHSARGFATSRFAGARARALFAGLAAHSVEPLDGIATASFALVLGMVGHAYGWPLPRGGAQAITDALVSYLQSLGGTVVTEHRIERWQDLPPTDTVCFDLSPRQLAGIGGDRLPSSYRRGLSAFRYGPAAFKVDWALREPIPWRNTDCSLAGTVHVAGGFEEIIASERDVAEGREPDRPFVLLAQPSLFDGSRAPDGSHTAWAYCHVPNGSTTDMTSRIEEQIERFAPGFRERILARHVMTPALLEAYNANYVGGDVVGGANDVRQILARPMLRLNPYTIPVPGWYLCSASTPPGGGVHGMCGYNAARSALRDLAGR